MYKYDQIWVGTAALQFMGLENHLCSLETLIININGKKKIILVGISISQDFKCIVQMLISIVIIRVQGSNLRGGMDFQNRWGGPPKFWVLLHFYVTISKFFPILTSLRGGRGWGLKSLRGGSSPPSPPPMDTYAYECNLWNICWWIRQQPVNKYFDGMTVRLIECRLD